VKTLKSGERVIIDPEMTINRISLIFYCFVNIGGLFGMATAYAEKLVGFWLAFLLPGIIYFALPILLLGTRHRTIRKDPDGSVLSQFFMIISMALKRNKGVVWKKGFFESVKPSVLAAQGITSWKGQPIPWTDKVVDDVGRVLNACAMFLFFPIWYLNDGGIGVVATSQAANLKKDNATNDLLGNFNPLTIIVFVPLLTYAIYPALERAHLMPGRVTRITFGFALACLSSIAGALIQLTVYRTSPCGRAATTCKRPAPLSVWVQVPIFALGAMSECFCQVTAYEIAYARAPASMRAVVMAVFLFMNALSSALALLITPAIRDPNLVWVWAGPALALLLVAVVFYRRYRWMNTDEFMLRDTAAATGETGEGAGREAVVETPVGKT
jgi:dipeptide/tripeptide permease